MLIAHEDAKKKVKKFQRMDNPLPNGIDLFDVANLAKVPTDVQKLLDMAADG
jgi:hypothetical protein